MITIILLLLYFAHDAGQVLAIDDRFRMLRPEYVLTDAERSLAKVPRLCIATLSKGEFCQVVE
ncbi:MAG TPA: hypothetical protein VKR83_21010 [Ktedonobacteraceae bacterium]|nr:hypothetical protein [Ktedonobacteraceae bacterium]